MIPLCHVGLLDAATLARIYLKTAGFVFRLGVCSGLLRTTEDRETEHLLGRTKVSAYRIVARVESQQGSCEAAHCVGDEFVIGQVTPLHMCSWAFYTLYPFAQVLQFGGRLPWELDHATARVACPDPDNPVVFELRRIPCESDD